MQLASLPRKVARGLPYLGKELRAIVSDNSPFFIALPRTVYIWRGEEFFFLVAKGDRHGGCQSEEGSEVSFAEAGVA